MTMLKKIISKFGFPILTLFIIIFFFSNLFYPKLQFYSTPDFGESDIWMQNIPFKYVLSESLKENRLPLWSSSIGNGFPLFAETQIGALNPVNLILFKFLPFPIAFNLEYPIAFLLTCLGTYIFCRQISMSRISAFFTGIIYGFSGYFIVQIPHTNLVQTTSMLPWMFATTYLIFKNSKIINLILLSVFLAISIFSGYAQITFISLLGILLFFFYLFFSEYFLSKFKKRKPKKIKLDLSSIFKLGGAIIFGFMISAIQFLPSLEFLKQSERSGGFSLDAATYLSFPPEHLLGFIDPFVFGNPRFGTYLNFANFNGSIFWENTGYIGLIPILLFVFSLFLIKKNRLIPFFWALAVLSALLMFGSSSPIKMVYQLPVFNWFRVPSRFILLFVWSISILAGLALYQIETYLRKKASYIFYYSLISALILLSFINLYFVWHSYNPKVSVENYLKMPESAKFLKQTQGNKILALEDENEWNKIFLKKGWENISPYLYLRNYLRQDINLIYGIDQEMSYAGTNIRRQGEFNDLMFTGFHLNPNGKIDISTSSADLMGILGISNIITPYEINGAEFKKVKTIKSPNPILSDINIYQKKTYQRAYIVYKKKIAGRSKQADILTSNIFNPLEEVILEKDDKKRVGKEPSEKPDVKLVEDNNVSLKVKVRKNNQPGYLILSDTYYPGWKAFIDGKETEIFTANISQRAIFLPQGDHDVVFKYEPFSIFIGKIISIFSLAFIAIFLFRIPLKNKLLK